MNKEKNNRIMAIFRTAKAEYIRIVTDPRILMVGMLMIVMANLIIRPLLERAEKYGAPINAFEPFIAVANSGIFSMFIPAIFIILASDFPDMSPRTLFFIQRAGKINWLLGQILSIIMIIVTYIGSLLVFTSVYTLGHNFFGSEWSDPVTKYIYKFPEEKPGLIGEFLSSKLYNQMSLGKAFVNIVLLVSLYMLILSMILIFFRIINLKAGGIFSCFLLIALGALTSTANSDWMWCFPMAHSIVWMHYTELWIDPVTPLYQSYLYFGGFFLVMLILNLIVIKKMNVNTSGL